MTVNFMIVCFCVAAVTLAQVAVSWGCCVVLSLTVMGMDHWFGMLFENTAIANIKGLTGDVEG